VLRYETHWNGLPLEEDEDSHLAYLERFCEDFVGRMKDMVEEGLQMRCGSFLFTSGRELSVEVLHHASMAVAKSRIFCGREDTLEDIHDYIQSSSESRSPLVLHGLSGQGKTAVMAVAARHLIGWMSADTQPISVLRFLGTTPSSSDILSVLRSIITQLSVALNLPVSDKLEQLGPARKAFCTLLERIAKKRSHSHVVIFLDSVDQLSKTYGAHQMTWLPRVLPKNVHIVVSMLSEDVHDCLINTRNRLGDGVRIVELNPLGNEAAVEVIRLYLSTAGRCLTTGQLWLVTDAVLACRQPLFVKLVLDQAASWTSYAEINSHVLPTNIHDAIWRLFAAVEARYGVVFVSHALAYLTCSRGGLSGMEMEDILSCDDEV